MRQCTKKEIKNEFLFPASTDLHGKEIAGQEDQIRLLFIDNLLAYRVQSTDWIERTQMWIRYLTDAQH
jgi:hypothetical protein